ncbi:hypothetical protein BGZ88_002437 [Linnemannia elongata]|nr:hypothetical protein BGZ88_002437 [Linnemannia elongata]
MLSALEITGDYNDRKEPFSNSLDRWSAGLKKAVVCVRGDGGPRFHFRMGSFDELLRHSSTVEILRFKCEMNHYLGRLNMFAEPYNPELGCGSWLEAHNIVTSDWIYTNLKILACFICGIPRSRLTDDMTFYTRWQMNSWKRTSGRRREFCSLASSLYLVARLTKLQELRLSFLFDHVVANYRHTDTITHRQYDCLSMKPESGLGLIENIRELRIVGLDNMKVGIDSVAEEWAAENCPSMVIRYTEHNLD